MSGHPRRRAATRAAAATAIAIPAAWAISRTRAVLRARWAWRCSGRLPRNSSDPLEQWEREELITIARGLKGKAARPERTRT